MMNVILEGFELDLSSYRGAIKNTDSQTVVLKPLEVT
jgi:hypothetical protein